MTDSRASDRRRSLIMRRAAWRPKSRLRNERDVSRQNIGQAIMTMPITDTNQATVRSQGTPSR